jgi:hypothetical protein
MFYRKHHIANGCCHFRGPYAWLFAAQPQWLSRVLGVVIRTLSTALLKRAGLRHCDGARTGMVTYVQRFGSKLNLNVHLHVLALDGGYSFEHSKARFHRAGALHPEQLQALLSTVITRVTRTLVAARLHRPLGSAGATPQSPSSSLPRGIRAQCPPAGRHRGLPQGSQAK